MTKTTSNIAAACFAILLTLATFQQALVVPADLSPAIASAELA